MYRFNSQQGFLFFPYKGTEPYKAQYDIVSQNPAADKGSLTVLGLPIPEYDEGTDYKDFISMMHRNEEMFLADISN